MTRNLHDYYDLLLAWEGLPKSVLIDAWDANVVGSIHAAFQHAASQPANQGLLFPIRGGSTNQSIGHQVAECVAPALNPYLKPKGFAIVSCSGPGYPDRRLMSTTAAGVAFPLELKATSKWDASDGNRVVLTSSTKKLRANFSNPINHLLLTVWYEAKPTHCVLKSLRLDFLEPTSQVNVRLEAAVSHKLLHTSQHKNFVL